MIEEISFPVAIGAGLLSFLSPCVLPLVPVYLGILGGSQIYRPNELKIQWPLFFHSLAFVLGFSLIFTAFGVLAGLTGLFIDPVLLNRIGGGVLIFWGVFILAAQKLSWLNYGKRVNLTLSNTVGYLRSFIIGAAFSVGWTACVGPILAGILTLAAVEATAWQGGYLLLAYSFGLGLPFLIMGAAFGSLMPLLKKITRYSQVIHIISSLLFICVGILILTDKLWLISAIGA